MIKRKIYLLNSAFKILARSAYENLALPIDIFAENPPGQNWEMS